MATGKKKKSGGRVLVLLALVLIFGLGAVFLLFKDQILPGAADTPEGEQAPATEGEAAAVTELSNMVDIYVLQQPVAKGQIIEEGHLLKVAYPRERLVEGLFILNPADAIGKRALADYEVGLPLTMNMLSSATEGSYASFMIPKGYVAVTIPLQDDLGISSVAYSLRAGGHVNVISSLLFVDMDSQWQTMLPNVVAPVYAPAITTGTSETGQETITGAALPLTVMVSPTTGLAYWGRSDVLTGINDPSGQLGQSVYVIPSEEQRPRLVSQTLIQDAIVLWVGEYPLTDEKAAVAETEAAADVAAPAAAEEAAPVEEVVKPKVVTLIVSPQDAVTINYMILADASLSLALRSAGDDTRVNTESVTLQFVMQQYNIPLPSQLAYGTQPAITELNMYDLPEYVAP